MFLLTIKNSTLIFQRLALVLSLFFVIGYANATQPFQVKHDVPYNKDAQLLDLYLPKLQNKNTAIMFIHGGGFGHGSKEEMKDHATYYAEQGFVTTSINYRLSLNYKHPTAINDATDALKWMKSNATHYGYDPKKIILVGYSAGGTIALNVGLDHQNEAAAIVDVAGIADIEAMIKDGTVPSLKGDMHQYLDGQDPSIASPITQANKQSPPTLVMHGKNDGVVSIWQSIALVDKLKEVNAPVTFEVFYNAGHEIMLMNSQQIKVLLSKMTKFIMSIEAN